MVKYLKYIVIIFSTIGLLVGGFFYYQNQEDIGVALEYNSILDYDYLKTHCLDIQDNYYYPCLKDHYTEFLKKVSLTGTNIGMKMVFTVMDQDKAMTKKFKTDLHKQLEYTTNYLEINNLAINNAYKKYFGMENLYGGFLASLDKFYTKAFEFSENLIIGMESFEGLESVKDPMIKEEIHKRFLIAKSEYYQLKQQVSEYIEKEMQKLNQNASQ